MPINRVDLATSAAKAAAEVLLAARPSLSDCQQKESIHSIVTPYDLHSEQIICRILKASDTGTPVISEETAIAGAPSSPPFWVIDPLDGTSYFLRGLSSYSVSIAYVSAEGVVAGVVLCPATGELFTSERGAGAFSGATRLSVSNVAELKESIATFGHRALRELLEFPQRLDLIKAVRSIRAGGSCAQELAYIASGRVDLFFAPAQSVWDFAAGLLLVEEAGGTLSDATGQPLQPSLIRPKAQSVVASNRYLQSSALRGLC